MNEFDYELFNLLRDCFPDTASCLKAVEDAQRAKQLFKLHYGDPAEFDYALLDHAN